MVIASTSKTANPPRWGPRSTGSTCPSASWLSSSGRRPSLTIHAFARSSSVKSRSRHRPVAAAPRSASPPGLGEEQRRPHRGHPRTIFRRALERGNLVLAEVTAREIGRVMIAEALELTALVARKQPHRYGRFAARWLCLYLEEHEKATLEDVALLVSNLRSTRATESRSTSTAAT